MEKGASAVEKETSAVEKGISAVEKGISAVKRMQAAGTCSGRWRHALTVKLVNLNRQRVKSPRRGCELVFLLFV